MNIRNNWFFMLWKAALVAACIFGLAHHVGPGRWSDFNYYTILSNTVCLLYFGASLAVNLPGTLRGREAAAWHPRLEGAVVFGITVTLLIYHFVLRPGDIAAGKAFYTPLNMTQHYVVPIMSILDWLLLCPKGRWRPGDPLLCLLLPLAYFVYILLRAPFAGNIGDTGSPYPYGFIDVQALGVGRVALNALLCAAGMLSLAYVYYLLDRWLGSTARKRASASR